MNEEKITMQKPESNVKKVVSTEYVDKSANDKLSKQQLDIKETLLTLSDFDELQANLNFFRGKNLKLVLPSHYPYFDREETRTKSLKLDDFISEGERRDLSLSEVLGEGLPRGQYEFMFYDGTQYIAKTPFALNINETTAPKEAKKASGLGAVNWQELISGAAMVALPKIIENWTASKSDNTQSLLLEHMRQQEEARREDRREMKQWMKENSSNDDPLHLLDLMEKLDQFKSTLAKPPAPPPINTASKWEKIAEKGLDFLSQQKQATPAPQIEAPAPEVAAGNGQGLNVNFDEQQVLDDLRTKLYTMLEHKEDPFKVLLGLRDLYVVGEKIGLQHIPEWEAAGGDAQDAFALFISKSDDLEYTKKLLDKAEEFIPLLGGAIDSADEPTT
jgi:hypothetical protein